MDVKRLEQPAAAQRAAKQEAAAAVVVVVVVVVVEMMVGDCTVEVVFLGVQRRFEVERGVLVKARRRALISNSLVNLVVQVRCVIVLRIWLIPNCTHLN